MTVTKHQFKKTILNLAAITTLTFGYAANAAADDYGCTVLLCLANPAGASSEPECRPSITRLWEDLARMRPFPICIMGDSSSGTNASNSYLSTNTCPPQYLDYSGEWPVCTYSGVISLNVNNAPYSQVYWNFGGSTTEMWGTPPPPIPGNTVNTQSFNDGG